MQISWKSTCLRIRWFRIDQEKQNRYITEDKMFHLKPGGAMPVSVVPETAGWMIVDYRVDVVVMRQRLYFYCYVVPRIL